jgi:hypothetical protein
LLPVGWANDVPMIINDELEVKRIFRPGIFHSMRERREEEKKKRISLFKK